MSEGKKRSVDTESKTDAVQKLPIRPLWDGWGEPTKPSEALDIGAEYAKMEGLWCSGTLLQLRDDGTEREHQRFEPRYIKPAGFPKNRKCACPDCVAIREYQKRIEAEGLTCGNIQACSVGILIMATMDGPAVNAYLNPRQHLQNWVKTIDLRKFPGFGKRKHVDGSMIEELLVLNRVGGPACLFLHAGMLRLIRERVVVKVEAAGEDVSGEIPSDPALMIENFISGPRGPRGGKFRGSMVRWRKDFMESSKQEVIAWNDGGDDEGDWKSTIPLTEGERRHEAIYKGFLYGAEYARKYESQLGFGADAEPVKV